MESVPGQAASRKSRRWVAHAVWAVLAMALFVGGILLGMRWSSASLGTMAMTSQRAGSFGRMRIALHALDEKDPAELRKDTMRLLYEATFSLAGVPRYSDCKPAERDLMMRAKSHLEAEMPSISDDYTSYRNMAYAFCEKAPDSITFP